jgi:SAM-dependent methyltransferase
MRGEYVRKAVGNAVRQLGYRIRGLSPHEAFWHERAIRLGARADSLVSDFETEAEQYRPALQDALHGTDWPAGEEWVAVDYGCGTGRFTRLIAEAIGGRAIGVDPCAPMLRWARPAPSVSFARLRDGRASLADASADLVVLIHVLGGLGPESLRAAVTDVDRILRPGGVLFIAEAAEGEASQHWRGRPASFYRRLWRRCPLLEVRPVMQCGRSVNLMWGLKG